MVALPPPRAVVVGAVLGPARSPARVTGDSPGSGALTALGKVSPDDAGGPIGHLGYFRSRFAQTLWPDFIGWLLEGRPATVGRKA